MRSIAVLAVAVIWLGGCGWGDPDEPPPRAAETVDPLGDLPREWRRHVNAEAGFVVGVPPGWSARQRGAGTLLRSGDRLAALSISADRTESGLALPLDEFAARVAEALRGFRRLRTGPPRAFPSHYEAVAVRGAGAAREGGTPQRLTVVVERRPGIATFTSVAAINAERSRAAHRRQALRAVRTLRGRPPRP